MQLTRVHPLRAIVAVLAAVVSIATGTSARPLTATAGKEVFPEAELIEGTTSDPAQCASLPTAVWVVVDGKGDCVRYYAAGLKPGGNPDLLMYFHGDRLALVNGTQRAVGSYRDVSPDDLLRLARTWSSQAGGLPFLFVARPGVYGSSGDHTQRRRPREVKLMSAALDAIKVRHGAVRLHLAGQSGGGHITGAMLNMRQDIECAAIASGAVAVWKRVELMGGRKTDMTGYRDSYDPVDEVARIRRMPAPIMFVLSDPEDRTVPYASQLLYVERLAAFGHTPYHVLARAPDPARHSLDHLARPAIRWCAQKVAPGEIKFRLEAMNALGATGE